MTLNPLPQLAGGLFLGDGGIETSLIFLDGLDLPEFASFVLLRDDAARGRMGEAGKAFAAHHRGATEKPLALISRAMR